MKKIKEKIIEILEKQLEGLDYEIEEIEVIDFFKSGGKKRKRSLIESTADQIFRLFEQEKQKLIKITSLDEDTPDYEGYSDLIKIGDRYFRTRDAEGYRSYLEEIDKEKYERLLKYKKYESCALKI